MEEILNNPAVAVLWTILCIVVVSTVALQWAKSHGRNLGLWIGKKLPGDQVERWLVEFLTGLKEGLEATYGQTVVETTTNWKSTTETQLTVNVLKNPSSGRAS